MKCHFLIFIYTEALETFSKQSSNEDEIFGIENQAFAGIDQIDFQEPLVTAQPSSIKALGDIQSDLDDVSEATSSETVRVAQQIVKDAAEQALIGLQTIPATQTEHVSIGLQLAASHQHQETVDPDDQVTGNLLATTCTRTSSSTNTLTTVSSSDYQTCASFDNSKMSPQPGLYSSTSGEDVTLYASAHSQSLTENGRDSSASICGSATSDTLVDDYIPSELDTVMDPQDLIKGTLKSH